MPLFITLINYHGWPWLTTMGLFLTLINYNGWPWLTTIVFSLTLINYKGLLPMPDCIPYILAKPWITTIVYFVTRIKYHTFFISVMIYYYGLLPWSIISTFFISVTILSVIYHLLLLCIFKVHFLVNFLQQILHSKDIFLSWIALMCALKLPLSQKLLSQSLHLNGPFPSCI